MRRRDLGTVLPSTQPLLEQQLLFLSTKSHQKRLYRALPAQYLSNQIQEHLCFVAAVLLCWILQAFFLWLLPVGRSRCKEAGGDPGSPTVPVPPPRAAMCHTGVSWPWTALTCSLPICPTEPWHLLPGQGRAQCKGSPRHLLSKPSSSLQRLPSGAFSTHLLQQLLKETPHCYGAEGKVSTPCVWFLCLCFVWIASSLSLAFN